MLNDDNYELLKESFVKSQRLFNKLGKVARSIENLDYDESGLYQEEEDRYERHWLKLSSKIVDALSEDLKDYSIELLANDTLDIKELTFNLKKDDEVSKLCINFSQDDSLQITQIS